jgi:hypothetical protein
VTTILDIRTRTMRGFSQEIREAEKAVGKDCYLVVRDNTLASYLMGLGWDIRIDPETPRDQIYILPVPDDGG